MVRQQWRVPVSDEFLTYVYLCREPDDILCVLIPVFVPRDPRIYRLTRTQMRKLAELLLQSRATLLLAGGTPLRAANYIFVRLRHRWKRGNPTGFARFVSICRTVSRVSSHEVWEGKTSHIPDVKGTSWRNPWQFRAEWFSWFAYWF